MVNNQNMKPYPAYKPSGVPWLGDIPAHWDVRRLRLMANILDIKLLEKPLESIYLGLENIESKTGKLLIDVPVEHVESSVNVFRPGNILFGKLRPYLAKVAHPDFDGVCTTEILVIDPKSGLINRFLFYIVLSDGFIKSVDAMTYGTRMPRANKDQIGNMVITLPPLAEQQAIAAYLDGETARLDALADRYRRLLALLDEKRRALITHAVTRGLNPAAPLKDSGIEWLGQIPAHWEVKSIWMLFTLGRGRVISNNEIQDNIGPYPVYSSQTSDNGVLGYIKTYDFSGDYLTWTTDGANAGTVFFRTGYFNCTNVCGTMKPRVREQDIKFICYSLNSITSRFVRYDINPKLMNNVMARIKIQYPPLPEQKAIAEYLDQETAHLDDLKAKIETLLARLGEHRAALISAAVTGKMDVRRPAG